MMSAGFLSSLVLVPCVMRDGRIRISVRELFTRFLVLILSYKFVYKFVCDMLHYALAMASCKLPRTYLLCEMRLYI